LRSRPARSFVCFAAAERYPLGCCIKLSLYMPVSQEPLSAGRFLLQSTIGAFTAVLAALAVASAWRVNAWPGAEFARPAVFFLVMGATFALTNTRWRRRSALFKLSVMVLYGLFGALVVGGLTSLLR
jgi:hypothetical protein